MIKLAPFNPFGTRPECTRSQTTRPAFGTIHSPRQRAFRCAPLPPRSAKVETHGGHLHRSPRRQIRKARDAGASSRTCESVPPLDLRANRSNLFGAFAQSAKIDFD